MSKSEKNGRKKKRTRKNEEFGMRSYKKNGIRTREDKFYSKHKYALYLTINNENEDQESR